MTTGKLVRRIQPAVSKQTTEPGGEHGEESMVSAHPQLIGVASSLLGGGVAAANVGSHVAAVDVPCEILRRLARHKVRYDIAGCIFERAPDNLLDNAFVQVDARSEAHGGPAPG